MNDTFYMNRALELARKAAELDEIPVGAVIVKDEEIIGEGYNTNRMDNDPTCHAEIKALRMAASNLKNERLTDCRLYVTKEPCAMCAGAITHARIEKVIIGTRDFRYGACGTVFDICGNEKMNHRPDIKFGPLEQESSSILKSFFKRKRS